LSCAKDEELDEDDDEGWITPKNFAQKRLEMFGVDAEKKQEHVKVACMTTDFAMQVKKPDTARKTKQKTRLICLSWALFIAVK
jgi:hypothetical protein